MLWEDQDPARDEGTKFQTWHFEKFQKTRMLTGWLAGKGVWIESHHSGKTVPCHRVFSKGDLVCPLCIRQRPLAWVCYVPLYDDTGKPIVVMVRKHMREVLGKIQVYDPVKVCKGPDKFDSVRLLPDKGSRWVPSRENPRPEPDLHPWLLHLWGEQPLIDWVRARVGVKAVPTPPPAANDEVTDPYANAPPELRARLPETRVTQEMRDAVPGIIQERIGQITWPGKESANGKHPPPDG